jgi:FAD/FMN-containing dehydrogenase
VTDRDHPRHDEARELDNAMIDKRSLTTARCVNVADVIGAVNFARGSGLPVATRCGGHNGPGFVSVDDGLVIDLSDMRGARADPAARTAQFADGATQGDLDRATQALESV